MNLIDILSYVEHFTYEYEWLIYTCIITMCFVRGAFTYVQFNSRRFYFSLLPLIGSISLCRNIKEERLVLLSSILLVYYLAKGNILVLIVSYVGNIIVQYFICSHILEIRYKFLYSISIIYKVYIMIYISLHVSRMYKKLNRK